MGKKNDGGPAFPSQQLETQEGTWNQTYAPGMSMRDWFAGMIASGLAATSGYDHPVIAEYSYKLADAMLTKRDE